MKKSLRPRVLITAGPTREAMDPIRFLTNPSSGKMGLAIAAACAKRGADVVVVCGPVTEKIPKGVSAIAVESALEMNAAVKKRLRWADAFIATAAVVDWRFAQVAAQKIKKTLSVPSFRLVKNPDILADAGKWKKKFRPSLLLAGFSLETSDLRRNALKKLKEKNLDLIIGNTPASFNGDKIKPLWIEPGRAQNRIPTMTKKGLARRIAQWTDANIRHRRANSHV